MDTVRKTYIIWAKVTDTFEFLRFTHIFRNTNKLFWNFSNKNSMFDKKNFTEDLLTKAIILITTNLIKP